MKYQGQRCFLLGKYAVPCQQNILEMCQYSAEGTARSSQTVECHQFSWTVGSILKVEVFKLVHVQVVSTQFQMEIYTVGLEFVGLHLRYA